MNAPENKQLAVVQKDAGTLDLGPRTFEQALQFSEYLADSDLVPKDFKGRPGNCLIAIQWGAELGLKPLQAMQNLAVINGRPSLWGDAVIALVRASPLCEYVIETEGPNSSTCTVKRRGEQEQSRTFTDDDAKAAGLLGKAGPWTQYKRRMRQMRARAFALRDVFPDVLRGLPVAEEVMDMPSERHMGGPVDEVKPTEKPALPAYPQADFEKNLPAWTKLVADGKKTASTLLATLSTKAQFNDLQKATILSLKAQAVDAAPAQEQSPPAAGGGEHEDFVAAMDAAEAAQVGAAQ